jgi:AcrR family transcriptional regulator
MPDTPEEENKPGGMRRNLVEAEILEHAARLFSEKGYAATTLQDIAADLGTGRSSLYHYFPNKEEMLIRLVRDLVVSSEEALRVMHSTSSDDAAHQLRTAVEALLAPILEAPNRFRLLLTVEAQLPAEIAEQWRDTRRSIVAEVSNLVREGTRRGQFRAVDEQAATFTVLGMCNWVAWWPDRQRQDHAKLTKVIADLAVSGLCGNDARGAGESPQGALTAVRHELDRLESMIAPSSA